MYINEVIRRVREEFPNEYSLRELYAMCDEVSAMLSQENRPFFRECTLAVSEDGTVVLPAGVKFEYIERIIADGRELNREDVRVFNKKTMNIKPLNAHSVTVIYQKPYTPIRLPRYKGTAEIDANNGNIYVDHHEFIPGDILNIQVGDKTLPELPLVSTSYSVDKEKAVLELSVPLDCDTGESEIIITRTITEDTVCDAPFDRMYIDYIIAEIKYRQGDMTAYNQNMTRFNSRLSAYRSWLAERMPNKHTSFKNWW